MLNYYISLAAWCLHCSMLGWLVVDASQRGFYKCAAHLPVKVLPGVLCHQSEQREKGPTKWVEAGVAIIRVLSHSDASIPLWTAPATNTASVRFGQMQMIQLGGEQCLPSFTGISTEQRISFARKVIMIFWQQKKKKSVLVPAVAAEKLAKSTLIYTWNVQEPTKYVFYGK